MWACEFVCVCVCLCVDEIMRNQINDGEYAMGKQGTFGAFGVRLLLSAYMKINGCDVWHINQHTAGMLILKHVGNI